MYLIYSYIMKSLEKYSLDFPPIAGEHAKTGLVKTFAISHEMGKIINDFLTGKDKNPVGGKEELIAFNLIQRCFFNQQCTFPLLVPGNQLPGSLATHSYVAIPLSQIFRVLAYDIIVSYWLFADAALLMNVFVV